MDTWSEIREGIDRVIRWTKQDSILDPAAKVALGSIPVVGAFLASVYDHYRAEAEDPAAGTRMLLEILARLDEIGSIGQDDVRELFLELREQNASLGQTCEEIGTLSKSIDETRGEMSKMIDTLDRIEDELSALAWGLNDFDLQTVGDRISLYTLLHGLLSRSFVIFKEQDSIAEEIEKRFEEGPEWPASFRGRDDILWWGSRNGRIPSSGPARRAFRELRRVTDRMREVNLRVRTLVRANSSLLEKHIPVRRLDEHLSTWLAKYNYMRENHDADMSLVFVGVEPTNVPFPSDADIERTLEQCLVEEMKRARLDHVVV